MKADYTLLPLTELIDKLYRVPAGTEQVSYYHPRLLVHPAERFSGSDADLC